MLLLREAMKAAAVETNPSDDPVAARVLTAPQSTLAVIINESGRDAVRRLTIAGHQRAIAVASGGWALVLFDRRTADIIARTDSN